MTESKKMRIKSLLRLYPYSGKMLDNMGKSCFLRNRSLFEVHYIVR